MPEEVKLHVLELAYGGDAVARLGEQVVFAAGGLPGEDVLVQLTEQHKSYRRGRVVGVITPSPDRVLPPCPYFGVCGGCQWQYISEGYQLAMKEKIVRQLFDHVGKLKPIPFAPTLGRGRPFHYRNSAQFGVSAQGRLGYRIGQSHDILEVAFCPLLHDSLNVLLGEVQAALSDIFPGPTLSRAVREVTLRTAGAMRGAQYLLVEVELQERVRPEVKNLALRLRQFLPDVEGVVLTDRWGNRWTSGHGAVTDWVLDKAFRISATSFFQVNAYQVGALVSRMLSMLAPESGEVVLDAYSGVGLFSAFIAPRVGTVIAIEENAGAVQDARHNMTLNNINNVTSITGKVEVMLAGLTGQRIDAAVLDPPRAGLHPRALKALVDASPRRIVYVSCDPSTLARDVAAFQQGGYTPRLAQVIDMFPQTFHVETVALLTKTA